MATLEQMREKAKKSNISTPPFPEGGFEYKGFCVVPGDSKYFTSTDEVDDFASMLIKEEFETA